MLPDRVLRGRDAEAALLSGLLQAAGDGRSAALVLRGEPGIGKTALLEFAVDAAKNFRVLRARGVESESEIAFSGLQELFAPVIGRLDVLPDRQRAVLAGALALGPPVPGDPLAVRAATLSMLAAAAEDAPLLAVIDDAHWLDRPSAEALAFAARRLESDGVVALFALREEEPSAFDGSDLRELRIGALSEEASRTLLTDDAERPLAPAVVEQVVRVAVGNPLALLEVPGALSIGQREGRDPLPEPLPVGSGIERGFARRLEALPGDVWEVLLLAAASDQDGGAALGSALRARGLGETAFVPGERAGLIKITDGGIRFTHPLVRSVVYQSATGEQRRAAHAALAAACDETADRRAWHLAAATTGPDERVAVALEDAAARAAARGGLTTAAGTYERAAALSPHCDARCRRLLAAATLAHAAGTLRWASALVLTGLPLADTAAIRADFEQLAATIERESGSVHRARAILWDTAAAIADEDPTRATVMLIDATVVDIMSGNVPAAAESAHRALEQAKASSRAVQQLARVTSDVIAVFRGLLPADQVNIDALRRTASSLPELPAASAAAIEMWWASWYALLLESSNAGDHNELDRAIAAARERGALGILPPLLGFGAQLDIHEGRWTRASALASETIELADATGQPIYGTWGLISLAMVEAAQGREEGCRAHAARALELGPGSGSGLLPIYASSALGLLELGLGNLRGAVEQLQQCPQHAETIGFGHPNIVRYEPDLVEALHAAGDDPRARGVADLLALRAERVQSPWGLATAARCRGILTVDEEFEGEFLVALSLHEEVPSPFERARTELCFGERLRRGRRRADAREHLASALGVFEQFGASPWAERARRELQASGATARPRRDPAAVDRLTAQELRVALMIADGATTREAAAQLFLSPKTIEAHLGRAYRKLGVHNRAQLTATLTRQAAVR